MDRLKQSREPATVVALVGLALNLVLTVLSVLLSPDPLVESALSFSYSAAHPLLLVVLAGLVATCQAREATPHARGLAVLSLIMTALAVATGAAFALAGLGTPNADRFRDLPAMIVALTASVIALGLLITLVRRSAAAIAPAGVDVAAIEPAPAPVDPQLQPSWSPDAAVGTVWRRAGDAAAGAPATSWDTPGQTASWWGPAPATETPPPAPPDRPAAAAPPPPPMAERSGSQGDWSTPGPA